MVWLIQAITTNHIPDNTEIRRMKWHKLLLLGLATAALSSSSDERFAQDNLEWNSASKDWGTFWYVNADTTAFSADRTTGIAEYFMDDFGVGNFGPINNTLSSDSFTAAPRLTIGKTDCSGWGLQSTYWDFNSVASNGFAGLPATSLTAPLLGLSSESSQTRAYTFDVEATKRLNVSKSVVTASLGARYGYLRNSDSSTALGLSTDSDLYTMSAQSSSSFHGTGVTYSLNGIRPSTGPLALYAGGRLSNLFGDNEATANTSIVGSGPNGFAPAASQAASSDVDSLFIAESQIGIMWNKCLKATGGRMFAKVGFEYQYWDTPNINANSVNFSGFTGSTADVYAEASDLKTQFTGISIGAGYAW